MTDGGWADCATCVVLDSAMLVQRTSLANLSVGSTLLIGSAEYSIPIIDRLRFAVFYDIGMVYQDPYSFDSKVMDPLDRHSSSSRMGNYNDNFGFESGMNLPIGPLRLDYGIPMTTDEQMMEADDSTLVWAGSDLFKVAIRAGKNISGRIIKTQNELNPLFLDDAYRKMKTLLMKKIAWTLMVWSMLLGTTASAQVKVATLDLQKVFDGYWKTKQISDNLQGQGKEYEEQREKLVQQYQKLNEEFRVLREAIEDPAASELGKEKRTKEADAKLAEIRELEQSINDYDNTTRTQITETQNRMKKNIVREIRETVAGIARKDNYNMVLDIAALARTDTPIVLYHDGSADITGAFLTK